MSVKDFKTKLANMVLDLKVLEIELEENNWNDEDKILRYNELIEEIIIYLKENL